MTIKYLGKTIQPRNRKGQFKSSNGKWAKRALIIVAIMALAILATYPKVMAMNTTEYVTDVTAEVKLDCTSQPHINTEECAKRITDEVARTWAELKDIEVQKEAIETAYDEKFEAHNLAVCYLERYRGTVSFDECEE